MFEFDEDTIEELNQRERPIMALFYPAGLTPEMGRSQLFPLIMALKNAGIMESVVLDHAENYPEAAETGYIPKLLEVIDEDPARRGKGLVLLGHSSSIGPTLGLCRALGDRVQRLYLVATRAPTTYMLKDPKFTPISQTMMAIAGDRDPKMNNWRQFTTGEFGLAAIEADRRGMLIPKGGVDPATGAYQDCPLFDIIVGDLSQTFL
mmetsp:Transcript_59536/g.134296  ORF Transcript_59536/g.134296 Transcript_59536/m.134296 type:complete len:206 (+) Transcript_59536:106-723(+)